MSAAATATAAAGAPRNREFDFQPEDHRTIATLVYDEAGILLPESKMQLVYGRLAKRVRACGLRSFADYVALIAEDTGERRRMIDSLTTNHTKFFREDHHFDHFRETTWPPLRRTLETGGKVRLWSAACSSGEEPYTLAMTMLGTDAGDGARLAQRDVRILATDLSQTILAAARAGRYPHDTVRDVPPAFRAAWMRPAGDGVAMVDTVRALVAFNELNLLGEWPIKARFDAIFCRNVMIYFDEPTKEKLIRRLAERLVPRGFLYIGHSERVPPSLSATLKCVGRTIFQKVEA